MRMLRRWIEELVHPVDAIGAQGHLQILDQLGRSLVYRVLGPLVRLLIGYTVRVGAQSLDVVLGRMFLVDETQTPQELDLLLVGQLLHDL